MDFIFIRDLRVDARVGIYDWEQLRPQTLELDAEIGIGHAAGQSDAIGDTVDYGKVIERFTEELRDRRFGLLEALAEHLAAIVTKELGAPWIKLTVAKVGHVRSARRVGVVIERGQRPG